MRKIILSLVVTVGFGAYVFFIKSGNLPTQFSKQQTVPVGLNGAPQNQATNGNTGKNINCVYVDDEDNEGIINDDEEAEREGHYKCTTIVTSTDGSASTPVTSSNATSASATPPPASKPKAGSQWKDGTFVGDSVDAYYGYVQISATISGGQISDIAFLDYPSDRRTSLQKSSYALPVLKSEAISSQSANVNSVSGVTFTSRAFMESLASALDQAKM